MLHVICGVLYCRLINDLELYGWTFSHFGKDFIKTQKLSPDAFVQIALQLAYYRLTCIVLHDI